MPVNSLGNDLVIKINHFMKGNLDVLPLKCYHWNRNFQILSSGSALFTSLNICDKHKFFTLLALFGRPEDHGTAHESYKSRKSKSTSKVPRKFEKYGKNVCFSNSNHRIWWMIINMIIYLNFKTYLATKSNSKIVLSMYKRLSIKMNVRFVIFCWLLGRERKKDRE